MNVKRIFSVLWRLAVLAAALWVGIKATKYFTGAYEQPPKVALVTPKSNMEYLDAAAFGKEMEESGFTFVHADEGSTPDAGVRAMLAAGAEVIVVCCDTPFTDRDAVELAQKSSTTLIFVGAQPAEDLLNRYDKAWALVNTASHGGQLLGTQAAMAFREGRLPDHNADLVLDCMAVVPADYPFAAVIAREAAAECEHYGVYVNSQSTVSAAVAELEAALKEGQPSADSELPAETAEAAPEAAVQSPEVIFCAGSAAAEQAAARAEELGWRSGESPVWLGVVAESADAARALRRSGRAEIAVYYDRETATETLVQFARNAASHRYIAQDCPLQPDANKTSIFGYQILE